MPQEVIDFIHSQSLSVLAVEMLDGSPHGATVHVAFGEFPPTFFFETHRPYRKCEALFGREKSRATLVIGFNEDDRRTLQVDGEVQLISTDDERLLYNKIYFKKFPKKKETSNDPKFVFFSMTPTWWRYTDWQAPGGKKIISSEDK
ncbi:MAG: pyridoxamine 5'-phosphate oxidase family protein [Candidatus Pacebacteria bacterium]|nr:pyridoxamine 5'-phosphate oxidase family protein [Candidatus Paceibacterota bacterium]